VGAAGAITPSCRLAHIGVFSVKPAACQAVEDVAFEQDLGTAIRKETATLPFQSNIPRITGSSERHRLIFGLPWQ
jgi:hypothetical protein